ncbi:putative Sortilin-related receptor [Hypsibius exemplaris]|uniref:Sortilin-related receptor n=1 Tax=Hypsibius exemplaris TaxID=2072580 RepID=A0A9X6NGV5_HYPEX|nr:putative Sortilin-related receptor [Hypsibius exemplaris]
MIRTIRRATVLSNVFPAKQKMATRLRAALWVSAMLILYVALEHLICQVKGAVLPSSDYSSPKQTGSLFEGDISRTDPIVLDGKKNSLFNTGILNERARWPGGIVPYQFWSQFTAGQRSSIRDAMLEIENATCIRFVERTNETDYVYVGYSVQDPCSSDVGRHGGMQLLILANHCWTKGTILHELMHTLGFYHEQSRSDRDEYIEIVWDHIIPEQRFNFNPWDNATVTTFGLPYDFASVLHYGSNYSARWHNGKPVGPTILVRPKYAGTAFGLQLNLSALDIRKIKLMYKCRTDELLTGKSLMAGESLWSENGAVRLTMQTDGNLVLFRQCDQRQIWTSSTHFPDRSWNPTAVTMQANGVLAMFKPGGYRGEPMIVWSTDTENSNSNDAVLKVLNEGEICIHKAQECLWKSGGAGLCHPAPSVKFTRARVLLLPDEKMIKGQSIHSYKKTCRLALHSDKLVLDRTCDNTAVWSIRRGVGRTLNLGAQTHADIGEFRLHEDGHFAIFSITNEKLLQSDFFGAEGADLRLSDDCQLCMFKNGTCLWVSHTIPYKCPSTQSPPLHIFAIMRHLISTVLLLQVFSVSPDSPALFPVPAAGEPCALSGDPNSGIYCPSRGICLPSRRRCDGIADCPDGSDEKTCEKSLLSGMPCYRPSDKTTGMYCTDTNMCMPPTWLCDGPTDCPDGSDESGCFATTPVTAATVPYTQPTVGGAPCLRQTDGITGIYCPPSRSCLFPSLRCDGRTDCPDGSDERNCPIMYTTTALPVASVRSSTLRPGCTRLSGGAGIYCPDRGIGRSAVQPLFSMLGKLLEASADEEDDDRRTTVRPSVSMVSCWQRDGTRGVSCTANGNCMPASWLCNGENDCADGRDEENCPAVNRPVIAPSADGGFSCTRRNSMERGFQCVAGSDEYCFRSSSLCNGWRDCANGRDERDCRNAGKKPVSRPLPSGLALCVRQDETDGFRCGRTCNPHAWLCDGDRDCLDGSDERDCSPTEPQSVLVSGSRCVRPSDSRSGVFCGPSAQCMPLGWLCDGSTDCSDGFDEENCRARGGTTARPNMASFASCDMSEFRCENGQCIRGRYRCDGDADCTDGSDERVCRSENVGIGSGSAVRVTTRKRRWSQLAAAAGTSLLESLLETENA